MKHEMTSLALAFLLPLSMLILHGFKRILPETPGKFGLWTAIVFVAVLAAEATGLLQAGGFNPQAIKQQVLLGALCLFLIRNVAHRVLQ